MKLLSIIVPVYNVEKYIEECLESLVANKSTNIEIILVNDGSKDKSVDICKLYEKKDNRIIIVNKKNGGLSDARNYGIKNSNSKYLMFVDSDDYIESMALNNILDFLNKSESDVIMTPYQEFTEDSLGRIAGINTSLTFEEYKTSEVLLKKIFDDTDSLWPAWKFIVKKTFLEENKISFKKGFLHEDVDYTSRILLKMKTFNYLNEKFYFYRIERVGSIMSNKGFKSLNDTAIIVKDLKDFMDKELVGSKIKDIVLEKLSRTLYTVLGLYKYGDKEERRYIEELLRKNKYMLKSSNVKKHKCFNSVASIIGIKNLINLI